MLKMGRNEMRGGRGERKREKTREKKDGKH